MAKKKVFITDRSFPNYDQIVDRIQKTDAEAVFASEKKEEVFIREGRDADVVFSSFAQITAGFIEKLDNCKMILRTGIGVNTIDVEAATRKGIMVSCIPDYCREEVADHSAALILAAARKVCMLNKRMQEGVWNSVEAGYVPRLSGKTLGLFGFGEIARLVGRRMKAFGMVVLAYDPYVPGGVFEANQTSRADTLDEVFAQADVISLNLPLTQETHHLINQESFSKMKDRVCIVNTARGPLIDEKALVAAIRSGQVYAAGIDVFEEEPLPAGSELRGLDNVVLTPHSAYYSAQSLPELMEKSVREVERILRGEPLVTWYNKREMQK